MNNHENLRPIRLFVGAAEGTSLHNMPTRDLLVLVKAIDQMTHGLYPEVLEALHRLEQSCLT